MNLETNHLLRIAKFNGNTCWNMTFSFLLYVSLLEETFFLILMKQNCRLMKEMRWKQTRKSIMNKCRSNLTSLWHSRNKVRDALGLTTIEPIYYCRCMWTYFPFYRSPRFARNPDHRVLLAHIFVDRVSGRTPNRRHDTTERKSSYSSTDSERPFAPSFENGQHDHLLRSNINILEWRISTWRAKWGKPSRRIWPNLGRCPLYGSAKAWQQDNNSQGRRRWC